MSMETETERQFIEAFESNADAMFRHAYLRVYSRDRARELVQEAFLRTWKSVAATRERIDNLRAYIYRTLNNLIIDHARKKKSYSLEAMADIGFDVPAAGQTGTKEHPDALRALEYAQALDEPYRTVIIMRYIDDLDPKDIAEILGETPNTVSVRINRGMRKLQRFMCYGKR